MHFDVIVVGSGLVGASLALGLAQAGLKIAVVDAKSPQVSVDDADWDSRIYAVSPGSVAFLTACGAWHGVDSARTMRVEDMHIFGDDAQSALDFSAYEAGLRELAVIVESRQLQIAVWRALLERPAVEIFAPALCAALKIGVEGAELALADGRSLHAQLVVGADGANSWVRGEAGIAVEARSYAQTAVAANFDTAKPHRAIAYQWFRRDGILALLPLPGDRVSMVWSTRDEHAAELMALAPAQLAAQVAAASADMVGTLRVITPPAAFPLRLQKVRQMIKPRLALAGDATHIVHPLAGQGVNLGFRDARALTEVLAARGVHSDCGDFHLLRRYERARREDIAAMQLATDALQRLFNNNSATLARARNFGLRLSNRQAALKNFLVQHAVG